MKVAYGCRFMVDIDLDDLNGLVEQIAAKDYLEWPESSQDLDPVVHSPHHDDCQLREEA